MPAASSLSVTEPRVAPRDDQAPGSGPVAAGFSVATAASALAALGHEARLEIFRALVRAGDAGLAVHEVQERLGGIPRSTLAHHLGMLVQAGLVLQAKEGAAVISRADYDAMHALVGYLSDECCADAPTAGVGGTCPIGEVGC